MADGTFQVQATMDTLIVGVRELKGVNHYYVGFVPEDGVFVLVPAWIFTDKP